MSNKNFVKTIALPYAEALSELTNKLHESSDFLKDVETIYQVLLESEDLVHFFSNPLIHQHSKKTVVSNLFSGQVNDVIINFLFVIIDRKRISFLKEILQLYFKLNLSSQSRKLAYVYTVKKLSIEQQEVLIERLRSLTNSRTIELNIVIDPTLIAGLIIKIDSKVIDLSLYGQLQSIATFLHTY